MSHKPARGHSIIKNAVYQTVFQILTIITPLITSPHISRVLQADNLGKFTYSYSIVQYFMLVALLGVVNYGTRTIAQCKSSKEEVSKNFSNIYAVQVCTSLLAIAGYLGYLLLLFLTGDIDNVEFQVAILQSMWLFGALFDVCWLFFGLEEIRKTVSRNIIIKILTVFAVLVFVRREWNPLIVYTSIIAGGHLLSSLILVPMLFSHVRPVRPTWTEMKKHLLPNFMLFIPLMASSVFHTMDKTMLGLMAPGAEAGTKAELGYYYNADKLIMIPLGIINGFGVVFLPRASKLFANNKEKNEIDEERHREGVSFLSKTFELNILVTILLAFGIAGCAAEFVPRFFGPGYDACVMLVYLFVPVLVFKASSVFIRMQYLVPSHREKLYTIATIIGAAVNLVANAVLIPRKLFGVRLFGLGAVGAVIGTLVAEATVMLIQFACSKKGLPLLKWLRTAVIYTVIGALMLVGMRALSRIPLGSFYIESERAEEALLTGDQLPAEYLSCVFIVHEDGDDTLTLQNAKRGNYVACTDNALLGSSPVKLTATKGENGTVIALAGKTGHKAAGDALGTDGKGRFTFGAQKELVVYKVGEYTAPAAAETDESTAKTSMLDSIVFVSAEKTDALSEGTCCLIAAPQGDGIVLLKGAYNTIGSPWWKVIIEVFAGGFMFVLLCLPFWLLTERKKWMWSMIRPIVAKFVPVLRKKLSASSSNRGNDSMKETSVSEEELPEVQSAGDENNQVL